MINTLVVAIVAFTIGYVSGFLSSKLLAGRAFGFDADARINFLVVVITLVWLLSVVIDLVSASYETPLQIHLLMGAIVGYFFYKPPSQGRKK